MATDRRPSASPPPALDEMIAEMRKRRDALAEAEHEIARIPELVAEAEKADKAKKAKAEQRRKALEDEAQALRDRVRDAGLDLQETLRKAVRTVGVRAVTSEQAREALRQLQRLSPYPSVHTADDAIATTEALHAHLSSEVQPQSDEWMGLDSIPLEKPADDHRQLVAGLLPEALVIFDHNFEAAWNEMEVAEGTLNRLRKGQAVRPATWRAAVKYLKKARSRRAQ